MGKGVSQFAACGKCGGTGREKLQLADRAIAVCMSCQGEVARLINSWLGGPRTSAARDCVELSEDDLRRLTEAEFNPGSGDAPTDTVIFV